MKKSGLLIGGVIVGIFLITGCSEKGSVLDVNKRAEAVKSKATNVSDKVQSSIKQKSESIQKKGIDDADIAVEVNPIVDKKMEVVTKVKPEVAVVEVDKVDKNEIPVVVVDPVDEKAPVKEVEVLPVVDNTVGVVTKVKPTVKVAEEIPVESEDVAVVIDPVVE
jgi:hypothetical protein